ncbi:MAG: hypothetical protein JW893_07905 [Candidatus Omnitrophica bacterium]|nr:hypothetical protein [Candidatus Omnitrophota bacterium]
MVKPGHQRFCDTVIQDLMWEAEQSGFTLEDLADQIGGSRRTFENYKYGATPTLAGFLAVFRVVKPSRLTNRLAKVCGGYFIVPEGNGRRFDSLAKGASKIMTETSDVLKAMACAIDGGNVSKGRQCGIVKEIDEAVAALIAVKMSLEESNGRD